MLTTINNGRELQSKYIKTPKEEIIGELIGSYFWHNHFGGRKITKKMRNEYKKELLGLTETELNRLWLKTELNRNNTMLRCSNSDSNC